MIFMSQNLFVANMPNVDIHDSLKFDMLQLVLAHKSERDKISSVWVCASQPLKKTYNVRTLDYVDESMVTKICMVSKMLDILI